MTDPHAEESNQAPHELVVYDFDPHNLPPEYLKAIGLVAMASAQTEHVVETFIGALIGADNIETMALATHMGGPLKHHVARALIELNATTSTVVDDVDDLLDAIEDAIKKRNTLVHSPLIRHPDTGEVLSHRLRARGSLQLELKPISVESIEQDASLIYNAGMALMQYMILYGLGPGVRQQAIREPLDRSKKARAARRVGNAA